MQFTPAVARGLQHFISDVRNAKSKEDETKRVDKELANIRSKFTNASSLTAYQKKKYVWKLVYIFMLGYDVDFGHDTVVSLVASPKYSEKQVGYVAMSLLLKAGDTMMQAVVNSIRNDLGGFRHDDASTSLALTSIANVSGIELMQALHVEVQRVLVSPNTTPAVKKKAALCLLRLIRQIPDSVASAEFQEHVATLLQDRHLGVLTSTMSLLIGLTSRHEVEYSTMIPYAIHILQSLVLGKQCTPDYLYYRTPSPWLQIKLLRFLQYYPDLCITGDPHVATLKQCLSRILEDTDVSESVNKSNADHAVLFEAINLIVVFGDSGDKRLQDAAMKLLGKFISVREPNIRYLGLMTMSRLASLHDINKDQIKSYQSTVIISLKDADISVRRRALDLLFVMCDKSNAEVIVEELITYLVAADAGIKEQMVLKIAVLAERYASNLKWYVDTILKLISISGDDVSPAIWHRVIVIVTNNREGDLQTYVADTMFDVCSSKTAHEKAVAVGAYVLGEFGFLIAEEAGKSGEMQFRILQQHWAVVSPPTRAIMLTAFAKMSNLYAETKPLIQPIFERLRPSSNIELQQRANEYLSISQNLSADLTEDILREMPPFDTDKVSTLEITLESEHTNTHDKNTFSKTSTVTSPTSGTAAAPSAVNAPPPPPAEVDLLGGFDQEQEVTVPASVDAPPAAKKEIGIDPSLFPGMKTAFAKLTFQPAGVLFQDQYVQVGVKHEYRGSQGRVQLFIGNLGPAPLTDLKVDVPQVQQLRTAVQVESTTVGVKEQGKVVVMTEAMAPFSDAPACTISFSSPTGDHKYPLRLPIVVPAFCDTVAGLTKDVFMQRWQALQEKESQEIVQISKPVDPTVMATIAKLMTSYKFGRCADVDTAATWTGTSTYRTGATDPNGNKISVGCLVRVEGNGSAVRVTARTLHPTVSLSIKNVIKQGLSTL